MHKLQLSGSSNDGDSSVVKETKQLLLFLHPNKQILQYQNELPKYY
ncbi:MAG: hypothetical protein ACFFDI_30260 [Promethearchaeota archaeon]